MARKSSIPNTHAGRFQNLYQLLPKEFGDFNPTTSLQCLEYASSDYIFGALSGAFGPGDVEFEPYLLDTIRDTLTPASCSAFFRAYPAVPFTERDYYISKVFQFVSSVMLGCALEDDRWEQLTAVLEQIPDSKLPHLHELLDVQRLLNWIEQAAIQGIDPVHSLCLTAFLKTSPRQTSSPENATREAEKLVDLKKESGLKWVNIHDGTGVSVRRLMEISRGANPSRETREKVRKFFSADLKRSVKF